jgi:hypothetical protein
MKVTSLGFLGTFSLTSLVEGEEVDLGQEVCFLGVAEWEEDILIVKGNLKIQLSL